MRRIVINIIHSRVFINSKPMATDDYISKVINVSFEGAYLYIVLINSRPDHS